MLLSELHSRLEHLVSYSSQLIFVSGETIAQQQRTLEAFISQQGENTEVAFISATEHMQANDYRRQFCRQLLGQTAGSFVRPLNELLAELNQHDGPVLICITQAERLPDPFLQELWELVLQSRFASNKQHLNVLLFGQPQWAEHAKKWLPAKNSDKPLLLHSESVLTASAEQSELEQLIAHKRKAFDSRLRQRAQSHPSRQPVLAHWWMKLLIATVFVLSFSTILLWQYFDLSVAALAEFKDFVLQTNSPAASQTVAKLEQQQPIAAKQAEAQIATEQQATEKTDAKNTQQDAQRLITDWQTAVKQLPQTVPNQTTESKSSTTIDPISAAPASTASLSELGQVNDYAIEDVTTVAQLPTAPLNEEASTTVSRPSASNNNWDEDTILALNAEQYLLQLAGVSNIQVLRAYLADNQLDHSVWVYRTRRFGGDWYVVVYRQAFDSLLAARQFSLPLAPKLLRSPVFAKAVSQAQKEIALIATQ